MSEFTTSLGAPWQRDLKAANKLVTRTASQAAFEVYTEKNTIKWQEAGRLLLHVAAKKGAPANFIYWAGHSGRFVY